jgi:spore coat protein CotH
VLKVIKERRIRKLPHSIMSGTMALWVHAEKELRTAHPKAKFASIQIADRNESVASHKRSRSDRKAKGGTGERE